MQVNWEKEMVVITSGSYEGVSKVIAETARSRKAKVAIIARSREDKLQHFKEIDNMFFFPYDFQNLESVSELYNTMIEKMNAVPTLLINDIRFQISGFVTDTPVEAFEQCYRANALFPVALLQAMLPDMMKNNKGRIANILSAVVYHSFPGVSAYFSAKSALGAIHEALNIELAGTPVKTLYIRPGGYLSNYWKNTEIGSRIQDFKYPLFHDLRDPQYLVHKIFKAIEQDRVEVQIGSWKDRLGYHLSYWAPKLLDRIIAGKNRPLIAQQSNL